MSNKKYNILFIDDNNTNNVLIDAVITSENLPIECTFATSIEQAIEILENFERELFFPEFIFCDIKLPIKDGYYFAAYYNDNFYQRHKRVKMFFMTADIQEKPTELLKFPFVYDAFEKPFSKEIFNDSIEQKWDESEEE